MSASASPSGLSFTGGDWYAGDSLEYGDDFAIEPGAFKSGDWLTADFYNDGDFLIRLALYLQAKDSDRQFRLFFGLYPRVRARLRMPAGAMKLNAWTLPREGALLKPICGGDTVVPEEVNNLRLGVGAKAPGTVRWWRTPWKISGAEPPLLERADSAHTHLLDEMGQATFREWAGKTATTSKMISGLRGQAKKADAASFPTNWSRWGGWKAKTFAATGFFRTEHDGSRWWLVDPEGCAFWSTGLNCVRSDIESYVAGLEHFLSWTPVDKPEFADAVQNGRSDVLNFLAVNFIRAVGSAEWHKQWAGLAFEWMKRWRCNTVGNWSEWAEAQAAGFPYTRPLNSIEDIPVPMIFRDFPDVWHPDFERGCADWAEQLRETSGDPAFIGYFLTNEPTWCFAKQTPASGMLTNTESCVTRRELAEWLRQKYQSDQELSRHWDRATTFAEVESGRWKLVPESLNFEKDMEAFSGQMSSRLFDTLSQACHRVDPNHLNLGARFAFLPPDWMLDSIGSFDVFSFNSYSKLARDVAATISERIKRPVLIGEWHFGAMDGGMPGVALETVATQKDRAAAYANYLESHAAKPWCVGVHWFTMYDQSAIGRFDGECYDIGFLDVCNQPRKEICRAATRAHESVYDLAVGNKKPKLRNVEYLPPIGL